MPFQHKLITFLHNSYDDSTQVHENFPQQSGSSNGKVSHDRQPIMERPL